MWYIWCKVVLNTNVVYPALPLPVTSLLVNGNLINATYLTMMIAYSCLCFCCSPTTQGIEEIRTSICLMKEE